MHSIESKSLNLLLKIKPISLNQCFSTLRDGRRVRSKQYAIWVKTLKHELLPHSLSLRNFFNSFKPKQHEIRAEIIIHNPEMITIAKTISQKSGDLDNIIKPLFDNIFIYGIDDSQVTEILARKTQSEEWKIELNLYIGYR